VVRRDDRSWQRTNGLRASAAAALAHPSRQWSVGPVESEEELLCAYRVVYDQYVKVGYEPAHDAGLRITKHHLLPTTTVFVVRDMTPAQSGGTPRIVGTATLVVDGPLGLPLESLCGTCIEAMRARGARMGEVISNAVLPEFTGIEVVSLLLYACGEGARALGLTTLVSTYARHHATFFQSLLGAEPFGRISAYDHGHGAIAQCHRTNLAKLRQALPNSGLSLSQKSFAMTGALAAHLLTNHDELSASLSTADKRCIAAVMRAHGETAPADLDAP
jgi:hypothetical protein